ncbi:hypothetical protein DL96DRAFT_1685587 [Flagelloscypha sp. PMI_526]|nr:hypothetical protein DL96DRAFT_1685587 [Flagelloscypha sp. PMI_526]
MSSNAGVIHSIIDKMSLSTSAGMFAEHLADDFKAVTYPLVIGWPEKDKNGWIEHMSMGSAMYLERKMTVEEFIDAGDKIVTHTTAHGKFKDGTSGSITSMNVWTFNDSGKIVHMKQFLDSYTLSEMIKNAPQPPP